jgi:hypothetical protein
MTDSTTESTAGAEDEAIGAAFATGRRRRGASAPQLPDRRSGGRAGTAPAASGAHVPPVEVDAPQKPVTPVDEEDWATGVQQEPAATDWESVPPALEDVAGADDAGESGAGGGPTTERPLNVTVYPPRALVDRIEGYQETQKKSLRLRQYANGRVVLDALMGVDEDRLIAEVVRRHRPEPARKSRFVAMKPVKPTGEVNKPGWHFTMIPSNLDAADDLVEEVKARGVPTNRSDLLCTALDMFLPQRIRRSRKGAATSAPEDGEKPAAAEAS